MKWLVLVNYSNETTDSFCLWRHLKPIPWNAPHVIDFLMTGPLLTVIIAFGLIGGVLCFLTFARSYKDMKIYTYLLALAAWDVFYITTSFLLYNLPTLMYQEIIHFGPYAIGTPFLYYISTVARTGAIWTVLVIAFERYVALCYPFKFEQMNSENRVWIFFASITCSAFLYCLPRYFELKVLYCYELTTDLRVPLLLKSELRSTFTYWLLYRVIGGCLFYSIVPFLALVILTIRISYELRRSSYRVPVEQSSTPEHSLLNGTGCKTSADRLNRWMHVAMISKFLLCHSFPMILDIWELVQPSIAFEKSWYKSWIFMSHSSLFLLTINGSCNVIIYYLTSTKFRADMKSAITSCSSTKNDSYYTAITRV